MVSHLFFYQLTLKLKKFLSKQKHRIGLILLGFSIVLLLHLVLSNDYQDVVRDHLQKDRIIFILRSSFDHARVIAPADAEPAALRSDLLAPALRRLSDVIRRLHEVRDASLPLNAWLHDGDHWHLELFPRTARLAGLELGAEVYINAVPPEEAATALRR